jgi:hypothetical protein
MDGQGPRRDARFIRRVIAPAIACSVLIGLLASPAAAFHIPGAAYNGRVAGGGSISFSVSGDGSSVINLALTGPIQGPGCTASSRQYNQPIPIANNRFNNGEVSGGFANVQGAYGYFNVVEFGLPSSCRVNGTWSATTNASPTPSEECKSAKAKLKKAKRALRKAERTGNQRKIKRLRKNWTRARGVRDKVCGNLSEA